jgi:hypothetical protein
MSAVRSLLTRAARLEQARVSPRTPIELAYGNLEAWEAEVQADIDAGKADPVDMPVVLMCVRRWHTEKLWAHGIAMGSGSWADDDSRCADRETATA